MISLEFLLTSLVVVLIPGTGVLIYRRNRAFFGSRRASLYAAAGCTLGILPSLLASVLGLAVIFHTSALAFQVIKFAGVLYLLYLAWSMWRSSGPLSLVENGPQPGGGSIAVRGFLINILNPKLSIFFLAFLPQFVAPNLASPLVPMLILGGVFMLMTLVVFIGYGLLAHQVSAWVVQSKRAGRLLQRLFAGSFCGAGCETGDD